MTFSRSALANEIAKRITRQDKASLAKSVAAYLIETGKAAEINSLERDIIERRFETVKTVEVTAITAHPLDAQQDDEIKRMVSKLHPNVEKVIINHRHETGVIGGIRLEFANQLLDLTASAKLSKLKSLTS